VGKRSEASKKEEDVEDAVWWSSEDRTKVAIEVRAEVKGWERKGVCVFSPKQSKPVHRVQHPPDSSETGSLHIPLLEIAPSSERE
jgi:hypothetical protein